MQLFRVLSISQWCRGSRGRDPSIDRRDRTLPFTRVRWVVTDGLHWIFCWERRKIIFEWTLNSRKARSNASKGNLGGRQNSERPNYFQRISKLRAIGRIVFHNYLFSAPIRPAGWPAYSDGACRAHDVSGLAALAQRTGLVFGRSTLRGW